MDYAEQIFATSFGIVLQYNYEAQKALVTYTSLSGRGIAKNFFLREVGVTTMCSSTYLESTGIWGARGPLQSAS